MRQLDEYTLRFGGDILKSINYISTCLEVEKPEAIAKAISTYQLFVKRMLKGCKILIENADDSLEQVIIK